MTNHITNTIETTSVKYEIQLKSHGENTTYNFLFIVSAMNKFVLINT